MTFVLLLSMTSYAVMQRDALFGRLLLFGLVVGFGELLADAWGVEGNQTLHYPDGLKIWCSPWYMPFAWVPVMVQVGWLAIWMQKRWGLLWATLATMFLGCSNIPLYEYLAKAQGTWAPLWVIPLLGAAQSAWILMAGHIALSITG